jgi:hypothetical protein
MGLGFHGVVFLRGRGRILIRAQKLKAAARAPLSTDRVDNSVEILSQPGSMQPVPGISVSLFKFRANLLIFYKSAA